MLVIEGNNAGGFCDRQSRRQFLKIGGLTMGGLSLTDLLRLEAQQGIRKSHRAIIMIYLPGGPSHQDLFDLKPDAPSEIRGEFKPISTNVPGIQISEQLPKIAAMMDKFVVIRSVVGCKDEHASNIVMNGYTQGEFRQLRPPHMGSVISRLQGPTERTIPPFVSLAARTQHQPYNDPGPGWLGLGYSAFNPNGEVMGDMKLNGITLDRLGNRKQLLQTLDQFRKQADLLEGIGEVQQRAFDVLTSSKLVAALDVSNADAKLRERYGKGVERVQGDASPMLNEQFLIARRLVEAGVRFVTLSYGFWDTHGNNYNNLKKHLPHLDQAVSTLVQDLHDRGLDKDVSVVVWGEFGRTPKINAQAGRDHWPRVSCALLAGGGMRTGQVIGTTTPFAEEPETRPIHFRDVLATLYHNVGIDIRETTVPDVIGKPNYVLGEHAPIAELI